MDVLWLSEQDVKSLLTVEKALPLTEDIFIALGKGLAKMPPKVYLSLPEHEGDLRAMPAYLPKNSCGLDKPFAGVKVVNSHPKNPEKGLPAVTAVLVLNDPATGVPLALISAGYLTDVRTGAAGGTAAKTLARPDSTVVGLVGCGRQAVTQCQAMLDLFPIQEVRVAGRSETEAEEFCRKFSARSAARFVPCAELKEACRADIVVTTTPARQPVVRTEWIKPGTHINAIGADAPGKQELESALLLKARVVVDEATQAFHAGEVNVPLSSGVLKAEEIAGSLSEVILKMKPGRRSREDITVFDSTGLAVQDVGVGAWVYQEALKKNKGTRFSL